MTCGHWITTVVPASSVPIVLIGGLWNRERMRRANNESKGGVGWQFIRYTVLTITVPIIGLRAMNNVLTSEAATLIGTAMGFAFGRRDERGE